MTRRQNVFVPARPSAHILSTLSATVESPSAHVWYLVGSDPIPGALRNRPTPFLLIRVERVKWRLTTKLTHSRGSAAKIRNGLSKIKLHENRDAHGRWVQRIVRPLHVRKC
jgi:hypothetical protein